MTARLNPYAASPKGFKPMMDLENHVKSSKLEPTLIELVKMRASQINGCAFCLDMHSRDARAHGETEQRLYVLPAWRETTLFTPRERAALEWTEVLTLIADTHAPDEAYDTARAAFDEGELTDLTLLIGTINIWNRVAIGFRMPLPLHKAA
ncbi:MAG: carboxymuconolactone decarboxylase family protein [Rhizomicrobium sp.]